MFLIWAPPWFITWFIIGIETSVLDGFVPDPWLQTAQPSPRAYWPLRWAGMSATEGLGQPSPEPWSLFLNRKAVEKLT